jgi:hypothetical protein
MYDTYRDVCEICKKGPANDVALYRTGEKGPGKDPHWRCSEDLPKNFQVDKEVLTVVAVIESCDKAHH